jgi:hypothetical protein
MAKGNMALLIPIKTMSRRSASDAKEVREEVAQNFKKGGCISWQDINKLVLNCAQLAWLVSLWKKGHAVVGKPGV